MISSVVSRSVQTFGSFEEAADFVKENLTMREGLEIFNINMKALDNGKWEVEFIIKCRKQKEDSKEEEIAEMISRILEKKYDEQEYLRLMCGK